MDVVETILRTIGDNPRDPAVQRVVREWLDGFDDEHKRAVVENPKLVAEELGPLLKVRAVQYRLRLWRRQYEWGEL